MIDTLSLSDALEPDDIDKAVEQLAATFGWDFADVYTEVRERAQGERDPGSLALAVASLHQDGLELALAADISAEDRRALAAKGQALSDGSYPIPDETHLHSAAVLAASGHGDVAAAKRLIRKRARELGVDVSTLPGFGDSDGDEDQDEDDSGVAATAYYSGPGYDSTGHYIGLSAGGSSYPAEAWEYDAAAEAASAAVPEVLRLTAAHPSFFRPGDEDFTELAYSEPDFSGPLPSDEDALTSAMTTHYARMANKLNSRGRKPRTLLHDSDAGRPHGRGHHRGCAPDCSTDHRQPRHGGDMHPEVARLLDMASKAMGNREKPHGNSTVHRPMSAAELHRARHAAAGRSAGRLT